MMIYEIIQVLKITIRIKNRELHKILHKILYQHVTHINKRAHIGSRQHRAFYSKHKNI